MGYFLELDWAQRIKGGQKIGGDRVFIHRLEDRDILILSDGLGSGIKANVLATLTGVMARQYVKNNLDITGAARIIMNTLPVCRERKISYATFTICDISRQGEMKVVEYDNPGCQLFRRGKGIKLEKKVILLNRENAFKEEQLIYSEFQLQQGDRLVLFSDGISQAGLGTGGLPLGWREQAVSRYVEEQLIREPELSARDLARRMTGKAALLDGGDAKDDITAAVVYYRHPRELLVITGPPMEEQSDKELAQRVKDFSGPVILSGGTTAMILSRELNRPLELDMKSRTRDIPPLSEMEGISLVTEGMLTLNKVAEILEQQQEEEWKKPHGAGRFCKELIKNDRVHFLVGTRVNEAHHNPSIPEEIGIRRTIIRRICKALEEGYYKTTSVAYI